MIERTVERDERTVSVENASYRWAYLFLSFGLLASAAYRGFARHEQAWDLLALVVLSGAVTTLYQGSRQVLSRRWVMVSVVAVVVALVMSGILVVLSQP
jgi:hypothetical protein